MLAKMQWGVCCGIGPGADLSVGFNLCQSNARGVACQVLMATRLAVLLQKKLPMFISAFSNTRCPVCIHL